MLLLLKNKYKYETFLKEFVLIVDIIIKLL